MTNEERKKLNELSREELEQILKEPVELSDESKRQIAAFDEMLERTTRITAADLMMVLR